MVPGTWSELDKYLMNEIASELACPAWLPNYRSLGRENAGEAAELTCELSGTGRSMSGSGSQMIADSQHYRLRVLRVFNNERRKCQLSYEKLADFRKVKLLSCLNMKQRR